MSLVKTLAKVAIGVAIAKGASSMMKNAGQAQGRTSDDGLFRAPHSPGNNDAMAGTPLEGMMDNILGGSASKQAGTQTGGLGDLLEQLGGAQQGGAGKPAGLDDLLGGLANSSGGGLGGLLGGLAGALQKGQQSGGGTFGEVLNSQFDSTPEPARQPSADQEAAAALMLSAMLQAAKADGRFDAAEQKKLMDKLGEVSADERAFVNAELQKPVDVKALARQIPRGLEPQVYMMSVLGIDLDSNEEAQYLHTLASELGISKEQVNHIHERMGVPTLYR